MDELTTYTVSSSEELENQIGEKAFNHLDHKSSRYRIIVPATGFSKKSAFKHMYGLVSVVISEGVTDIPSRTFQGCLNLKEVVIPDTIKTIGERIFQNCVKLNHVKLPSQITKIPKFCFHSSGLESIAIPSNVTVIEEKAFFECHNLSLVIFEETKIGAQKLLSIQDYAFSGCENLNNVNLPKMLESISVGAFKVCRSLTSIIIPDSVNYVGDACFASCEKLALIKFSNQLKQIRKNTFTHTSLLSIEIPDSVELIQDTAFYWCRFLTKVTLGLETTVEQEAFICCENLRAVLIRGNPDDLLPNTMYGLTLFTTKKDRIRIFIGTQNKSVRELESTPGGEYAPYTPFSLEFNDVDIEKRLLTMQDKILQGNFDEYFKKENASKLFFAPANRFLKGIDKTVAKYYKTATVFNPIYFDQYDPEDQQRVMKILQIFHDGFVQNKFKGKRIPVEIVFEILARADSVQHRLVGGYRALPSTIKLTLYIH